MKTSDEYLAELELKELIDKKIAFDAFISKKRSETHKSLEDYLKEEQESREYVLYNHILVKFMEKEVTFIPNEKNISLDTSIIFTMTYFIEKIVSTASKEQITLYIKEKIDNINENIKKYKEITKEEKDILNKYIFAGNIIINGVNSKNNLYVVSPVLGEIREYFNFNKSLANGFASSHKDLDVFIKRLFMVLITKEEQLPYSKGLYNLANKFAHVGKEENIAITLNYSHLIKAYNAVAKINLLKD